mmetsp:Transcript_86429/g.201059  ORF Transcript_86429/g.201059 Transcript_86429/m.201059 type:complete len:394 (-) Transcript_86429:78-1259(-)
MRPIAKLKPQAKLKVQAKLASTTTQVPIPRAAATQAVLPWAEAHQVDGDAPVPPRGPPPLRQTVEAYFSDANLKHDRHLREVIQLSPGGWVDIEVVLELKRVRTLKGKKEDVLRVVRDSPFLEIWRDPVDGGAAVRRSKGKPLPRFEGAAPPAPAAAPPAGSKIIDEEAAPPDEEAAPPPAVDAEEEDVANEATKRRRVDAAEVKPGARFVGCIKSYHAGLGMGFIVCRPTFEVFGRDIAVDRKSIMDFGVGDCVAFGLSIDPDFGTPKGVDLEAASETIADTCIQEAPADPVPRKPPVVRKAAKATAKPVPAKAPAAKPTGRTAAGLAGIRFVGKVMSVSEVTKTGKISCPQTFDLLGCHVTVAGEELAGFDVGDRVSFTLRAAKAVELEAE